MLFSGVFEVTCEPADIKMILRRRMIYVVCMLFLVFVSLWLLSFPRLMYACQCETPVICVAYSQADLVFTGELKKIEIDTSDPYIQVVYYQVEKAYKGIPDKIETQKFVNTECNIDFTIGERYFVYLEKEKITDPCNRTVSMSQAEAEIAHASGLSTGKPIYMIHGFISGLDEEDLRKTKISIRNEAEIHNVNIEVDGHFGLTAEKPGKYKVKIEIPNKIDVQVVKDGYIDTSSIPKISQTETKTVVEYELVYKPNECDYRTLIIDT